MSNAYDQLFQAILAMDSYNRGYNASLTIPSALGSENQLGLATITGLENILTDTNDRQALEAAWQSAGFYASAYQLENGKTVISYRGTDAQTLN